MRQVWLSLFVGGIGCSSTEDPGLGCRDLALASGPRCAPAAGAPRFGGAETLSPDESGTRFRVTWRAGTDDATAASALRYRVYASIRQGRALGNAPVVTTEPGAMSAWIEAVPASTAHFVVVRAVDETNTEDGNTVEKKIVLTADTTPPSFGGLATATATPGQGVTLQWSAASDDLTAPEGIAYVVYGGVTSVDFARPLAATPLGATTAALAQQGTPAAPRVYAVRARDAAGHEDANTKAVSVYLSPDVTPPVFAGCDRIARPDARSLVVSWSAATDDFTPPSDIRYEIHLASTAGGEKYDAPTKSVVGVTSATFPVPPGGSWFAVCRARDAAGNGDGNTLEKAAQSGSDSIPPTFAGVAGLKLEPTTRVVDLTWAAASDDTTAPAEIVYEVYEGTATGKVDFGAPVFVTKPGALAARLEDRRSASTLFWAVRARDAAYNLDANVTEVTGETYVSFRKNIARVYQESCAVVGCHVPGVRAGSLTLSPSFAYAATVNVNSRYRPSGAPSPLLLVARGDPANSYVYRKIFGVTATYAFNGAAMPAPSTGNTLSDAEKAFFFNWITQGAPDN